MTFRLLIIISLFLAPKCLAATDFSAIDQYVEEVKREVGLPFGTAVAIVKDGEIIYQGYFGFADIQANKKVTESTTFYLASITKPLFALSTLLMENNGDISDSSTLNDLFPKLDFPFIDKNKVQLKQLISHTHGLSNIPLQDTLAFTGQHNKLQRQKIAAATKMDPSTQLGQYQYGNVGYNLISIWAEEYFKQDWQKTIEQLVYQPLSMSHTFSYIDDARKKGLDIARPYHLYTDNPKEVMAFEKSDMTLQAAGGTYASASDLAHFLIAQLNEGKVFGKQIFPAEVIAKSHQILTVNDLKYRDFVRKGYAWGWHTGPYKGEQMFHHFGGMAGAHTHTSFMLQHNIGLVVLNNEETIAGRMTNGIADIAYSLLLNKGDVAEITAFRIQEMKSSWKAIQADVKDTFDSHKKRNASRTMQLTQKKSHYTGVFHNPLWGDLQVKLLKNDQLEFTLGELKAVATAAKRPDEVRIQFQIDGGKIAAYQMVAGKAAAIDLYGINPLGVETFTRSE